VRLLSPTADLTVVDEDALRRRVAVAVEAELPSSFHSYPHLPTAAAAAAVAADPFLTHDVSSRADDETIKACCLHVVAKLALLAVGLEHFRDALQGLQAFDPLSVWLAVHERMSSHVAAPWNALRVSVRAGEGRDSQPSGRRRNLCTSSWACFLTLFPAA
jgi:hypothetical protein